jgi:endonuclease-3
MPRISIADAIQLLRIKYGAPKPPLVDPWHIVLWENVVYLTTEERRVAAYALLKKLTGLAPTKILSASSDELLEVAKNGVMAEARVTKLRQCAEIALREFDGDLMQILDWPTKMALRALQKFPGIGLPGAEKILLFCRRLPVLALESNGLRTLIRLGFGKDTGNYAKSYSLVRKDVTPEAPSDYEDLIAAHQLLRRHGQEVCKATPECVKCIFRDDCPSATVAAATPKRQSG